MLAIILTAAYFIIGLYIAEVLGSLGLTGTWVKWLGILLGYIVVVWAWIRVRNRLGRGRR